MSVAVAWSLLAVGGVYTWARIPVVVLALAALAVLRPGIAHHADVRPLDISLALVLAAVALQLLPLPLDWRMALSPQLDVDRRALLLGPGASSARPLSLDPAATAGALALTAALTAIYWTCRHLCGRGHVWRVVQVVAIVGLVGSAAALAQRAIDPLRIYGLWVPQDPGARPFGPFVNRNHFATWLLMASALLAGGLAAHLQVAGRARSGLRSTASAVVTALESRRGLVALALAAMLLTLVASLSRGAFAAAAASVLAWALLGLRRTSGRVMAAAMGVALLLGAGAAWTAPAPILSRVQETVALGAAGRIAIWRDAAEVARIYPVAGAGMGSYERAMLVHQTTDRTTHANQAHNHYLHQVAEGGLLVAVPVLMSVAAFIWLAGTRLAADPSPAAWLRIGAMAAVVAVVVQSFWETGLRMPANGVLLAVVAAVATHRPAAGRH